MLSFTVSWVLLLMLHFVHVVRLVTDMNPLVQLHRSGGVAEWCEYSTFFMPWPKLVLKGRQCVDLDLQFIRHNNRPPTRGDILYIPYTSLYDYFESD